MANVTTDYLNRAMANQAKIHTTSTASGPAYTAFIGLYTNAASLSNATTVGALTEPAFDTYARQAVTWNPTYQDIDDSFHLQSNLVDFHLADVSAGGATCHGYFVADASSSGNLLWAEEFVGGPLTLATTDDAILISAQFSQPDNDLASGTVIS